MSDVFTKPWNTGQIFNQKKTFSHAIGFMLIHSHVAPRYTCKYITHLVPKYHYKKCVKIVQYYLILWYRNDNNDCYSHEKNCWALDFLLTWSAGKPRNVNVMKNYNRMILYLLINSDHIFSLTQAYSLKVSYCLTDRLAFFRFLSVSSNLKPLLHIYKFQ